MLVPRSPIAELIEAALCAVGRPATRAPHPRHRHRARAASRLPARWRFPQRTGRCRGHVGTTALAVARQQRRRARPARAACVLVRVRLFQRSWPATLRYHRHQSALRGRRGNGRSCRRSIGMSQQRRCTAGVDGLDAVRGSCARRAGASAAERACWSWKWATPRRALRRGAMPQRAVHVAGVRARRRRSVPADRGAAAGAVPSGGLD